MTSSSYASLPVRVLFIVSVSLSFDVVAGPPNFYSRVIPAVASIHGVNADFFRTDLWLLNQSDASTVVDLIYHCFQGTCPTNGTNGKLTLAPHETRHLVDVVSSLFDSPESAGALTVAWMHWDLSPPVTVAATSRTYAGDQVLGTYGMEVPADGGSRLTRDAFFLGLAGDGGNRSEGFRTNVGLFNEWYWNSGNIEVTLTLYGSDGTVLGSPLLVSVVDGLQVNDIFRAVGAGSVVTRSASLRVTTAGPVAFRPYVTVIDNRSGDSMFLNAVP